jgi:hypothetical protein
MQPASSASTSVRATADLLGLARGDEAELKVEDERLIVGPVEVSARAQRHRAKFAKAKARVHANVGTALQKLAK